MPGPKMGKMLSKANNAIKRFVIPFGRVASGTSTKLNIQNTANGEVREVKVIAPYGVSSCPPSGLFAQMVINDDVNNTCVGVHNPKAPEAKPGEVIIYSSGGAYIKLDVDGTVTISGRRINIG